MKKLNFKTGINLRELPDMLRTQVQKLSENSAKATPKQRLIAVCSIVGVLCLIIFFVIIVPKMRTESAANLAYEKNRTGYHFMLQNAAKVVSTPQKDVSQIPVRNAAIKVASEVGLEGSVIVKADKNNTAIVEIEASQRYSFINKFIYTLENKYGVTVDELSLDKKGDGLVYVANMRLVRLEREE